jgi:hypothetical protein
MVKKELNENEIHDNLTLFGFVVYEELYIRLDNGKSFFNVEEGNKLSFELSTFVKAGTDKGKEITEEMREKLIFSQLDAIASYYELKYNRDDVVVSKKKESKISVKVNFFNKN